MYQVFGIVAFRIQEKNGNDHKMKIGGKSNVSFKTEILFNNKSAEVPCNLEKSPRTLFYNMKKKLV